MKLSYYIAFIAAAALFVGCGDKGNKVQQPAKGPAVTATGTGTAAKNTVTPAPPPPVTTPKPAASLFPAESPKNTPPVSVPSAATPSVKPVTEAKSIPGQPTAKVVIVNKEMKFVVLEFTTSAVPTPGSQLSLYRGADRIATLKVSQETRPPLVAADILDGDPRKGDEIR